MADKHQQRRYGDLHYKPPLECSILNPPVRNTLRKSNYNVFVVRVWLRAAPFGAGPRYTGQDALRIFANVCEAESEAERGC